MQHWILLPMLLRHRRRRRTDNRHDLVSQTIADRHPASSQRRWNVLVCRSTAEWIETLSDSRRVAVATAISVVFQAVVTVDYGNINCRRFRARVDENGTCFGRRQASTTYQRICR
jgi:hypothetical protein